jgi:hypothetical protein
MKYAIRERENGMKRVKDAALVICLFIVLLVIFGSCFGANPAGTFFGALAGTPVLVHVFNRLVPRSKQLDEGPVRTSEIVAPEPAEQVLVLRVERPDRRA